MATIIKVANTLRNNWKKSVVGSLLISYGINYANEKYNTHQMMRTFCVEAQKIGDEPLQSTRRPRHVTVILNPTSKDGKCKSLFEKYSAPLFHLAGIRISIVQTEAEGEAKGLMNVMDNTDAVVIAGGNGTVLEAVTGLLRRVDGEAAAERFPIGVLPLGKTNTLAKVLFWNKDISDIRWLADSTMAVIREHSKPIDVMRIDADTGRPVFAVGNLEWGAFRDTESNVSKYWYWGPLKARMAFIFSALKDWPKNFEAKLSFTAPCSGCANCYTNKTPTMTRAAIKRRWWQSAPLPMQQAENLKPTVVNDKCGIWNDQLFKMTGIHISINKIDPDQTQKGIIPSLEIKFTSDKMTRTEFIREGIFHVQNGYLSDQTIGKLSADQVRFAPILKQDEESWYSIDSEPYEVKPVTIKLLPSRIKVFCSDNSTKT